MRLFKSKQKKFILVFFIKALLLLYNTVISSPPPPNVVEQTIQVFCGENAEFEIDNQDPDYIYFWFSDSEGEEQVGLGEIFETSVLTSNTSYWVGAAEGEIISEEFTFTNCDATGRFGPDQSAVDSEYNGTNLEGDVTVIGDGIQEWIVPKTATYTITTYGAGAGYINEQKGAKISGEFELEEGDTLRILVGQVGLGGDTDDDGRFCGSGMTAVAKYQENDDDIPLIVAGGAGGVSDGSISSPVQSFGIATETANSGTSGGNPDNSEGTDGNAGRSGSTGTWAHPGSGFYESETVGTDGDRSQSFIDGGVGASGDNNAEGGFGGGGVGRHNQRIGGGGGYSGGGSGGNSNNDVGGGGGSYNSGKNQTNKSGYHQGNGLVVISLEVPEVGELSDLTQVDVEIEELSIPDVSELNPDIYCGTSITLSASGSSSNYVWYNDEDDIVGTGENFTTPSLTENTTYYVEAVDTEPENVVLEFTNCKATGRTGPSQADCDFEYLGTNLEGKVNITGYGIQQWVVPYTATYTIEAYGAQGGSGIRGGIGGKGAKMSGEFELEKGQKLDILVGQQGRGGYSNQVGGGGGTFVVMSNAIYEEDILIIAGGGGGYGVGTTTVNQDKAYGSVDVNAKDGVGGESWGAGGVDGNGGDAADSRGSGGGGFFSDGEDGSGNGGRGVSYIKGGLGGHGNTVDGGFGGGGATDENTGWGAASGGGGYTGGGGGYSDSEDDEAAGGGGGSFNSGINQNNEEGVKTGHGLVVISYSVEPQCASDRAPINITVEEIDTPEIVDPNPIISCGGKATLSASGSTGEYVWYNDEDEIVGIGENFTTSILTENTTYYVAAVNSEPANSIWRFTNCRKEGRLGPTQEDADNEYEGTNLEGEVTIIGDGIQQWTVPKTATYTIEAYGAQGGAGTRGGIGGKGAKMSGDFELQEGEVIEILVGQQGDGGYSQEIAGGGGSFVVMGNASNKSDILIIAGGGGGYGVGTTTIHQDVAHATINDNAKNGIGGTSLGIGGVDGAGGGDAESRGSGGGGFISDGADGSGNGGGGKSFLNGGQGGVGNTVDGGFGGGGATDENTGWGAASGGGGYSGGGGGYSDSDDNEAAGGGGSSYNSGANQNNQAGVREGHGLVIISSIVEKKCASDKVPINITVEELISPDVTESDPIISCGSSITLNASGSTNNYVWFNENDEIIGYGNSFTTPRLKNDTIYKVAAIDFQTEVIEYEFTNCGVEGRFGPFQSNVNSEYSGTNLEGNVTVVGYGIQKWEVPYSATYNIQAYGAQGGVGPRSGIGGKGAKISGYFDLEKGDVLEILVGQKGGGSDIDTLEIGGGGGSFVVMENASSEADILIIAGGGGGYGVGTSTNQQNIAHATTENNAKDGFGGNSWGTGGVDGSGGNAANSRGSGGGGFFTDGEDGSGNGGRGRSYLNGGVGGRGYSLDGGFGGGGATDEATSSFGAAGGGGGYSGGGGGYSSSSSNEAAGGGGGSFNSGFNQNNEEAYIEDRHGRVIISYEREFLCLSEKVSINITIDDMESPNINETNPAISCGGITTLTASGSTGYYLWYDEVNEIVGTEDSFNTPVLTENTDYQLEAIDIESEEIEYVFTNCGVEGRTGPSQLDCDTEYSGTNIESEVTINSDGIQEWEIPETGVYTFTAYGARGGGKDINVGRHGYGAIIQADFELNKGDEILILVGQKGSDYSDENGNAGGGGTFIVKVDPQGDYFMDDNSYLGLKVTPLLVAGGGGGAFNDNPIADNDGQTDSYSEYLGEWTDQGGFHWGATGSGEGAGGGFSGTGEEDGSEPTGGGSFLNGYKGDRNYGIGGYYLEESSDYGGFGGGGGYGIFNYGSGGGGFRGGDFCPYNSNTCKSGGGSYIHKSAISAATSDGNFNTTNSDGFDVYDGPVDNLNEYNEDDHGMVIVTYAIEPICFSDRDFVTVEVEFDYYQTLSSGDWDNESTWEECCMTTCNPAESSPLSLFDRDISIRDGHVIDIDGDWTNNADIIKEQDSEINITGNWINQGTVDTELGGVFRFSGSSHQTIDPGDSDFNDIIFENTTGLCGDLEITSPMVINGNADFDDGVVYFSDTGSLLFTEDATSNEGSEDSFVDGEVEKEGTDAFVFPIGESCIYAPLGISEASGGDQGESFTARYYHIDPDLAGLDVTSKEASINNVSRMEYWILDRSDGGTNEVQVTLSWEDSRSGGIGNLNDLIVARWDDTQWNDKGQSSITGDIMSGTITSNFISDFSPFTLSSESWDNPLPIELLSFEAECDKDGNALITWETATEINNDYFILEKSKDGKDFTEIAMIEGQGYSNRIVEYSYIDEHLFFGDNYYRLKQVDFDGTTTEYNIIHINCDKKSDEAKSVVYPNPFRSEIIIYLENIEDNHVYFEIYSETGSLITRKRYGIERDSDSYVFELDDLEPSAYLLRIISDRHLFNHKIIKN